MYFSDVREGPLRHQASLALVFTTLFLALAAEFVPWPAVVAAYKPVFPMLALMYWAVHRPKIINYGAAAVIGILLDLANQAPMGFNVASCAVVVLLANIFASRFILLTGIPQALHVLLALAAGQFTLYLLGHLEERGAAQTLSWRMFWPSYSAALLWLLLPVVLRQFRRFAFGRGRTHNARL